MKLYEYQFRNIIDSNKCDKESAECRSHKFNEEKYFFCQEMNLRNVLSAKDASLLFLFGIRLVKKLGMDGKYFLQDKG